MRKSLSRHVATAATIFTLSLCGQAVAQSDYPTKPIRLLVGFSAGGSNDLIGRMFATKLSDLLGKQVVVENKPGAGGIVASEIVATAPGDGYTLMVVSIAHTANPGLYKLKYDTKKDFTPIAQLGTGVSVLAVNPSVPAKSVAELLALARKSPGSLLMAHAGIGTFQHMAASQMINIAKIDVVLVPFKGGGPATIDVVGGHTQIAIFTAVQVMGHMQSGKLRALAVGSSTRNASFPDLPTMSEAGIPGYEADNWWGIVGPAGIPKPIVDRLASEIATVQKMSDIKVALEREGAEPVTKGPAEFDKFLASELAKWTKVIADAKIVLQ